MHRLLLIILLALGMAGVAFGGSTFASNEKVERTEAWDSSPSKDTSLPLPSIAKALALVAGVGLLRTNKR